MSDNFKNYFFASAFVLLWEFVTDDEGKLVRIWHFCLCYAYLSNYVIFVMFLLVKCLFAISCYLCGYFFCLCDVYLSDARGSKGGLHCLSVSDASPGGHING